MKALLEKISLNPESSFLVSEVNAPYFEAPLHFHPELELTLIVKSTGKRFIGDHVDDFKPGDLILIGSNLPHFFRCDARYYQNNTQLNAQAITVQFLDSFIGKDLYLLPEMDGINQLYDRASRGLCFYGKTRDEVEIKMKELLHLEGLYKMLALLSIFDILAESQEYNYLSSPGFIGKNDADTERMNKVYEYLMTNFKNQISLDEISSLANMSSSAFCRYFKKRTRKTFYTFLNELRIGYACKLLMEETLNVTEICYESGFNNLSNFNRQFRAITKESPINYQKHYLNNGRK
jgi:AraC-like DNA-binding protein